MASYDTILVEQRERVGLITLNRPKVLNALNRQLTMELLDAAEAFDRDPGVGCIVITGSEKAFAAGADINEMKDQSYTDMYASDWFSAWDRLVAVRTPLVAAVAGFALGGGCELAMMCDVILAADTAKFGQPEIKLGVMPGIGGSQRLTRFVGKAKAMEMCLTGRMMDAAEAERSGLVSRVIPAAELLADALKTAETIASMSLPITMMTKESINRSYETTLTEGVASSGESSIRCLRPPIRRRGWPPSSTSGRRYSNITETAGKNRVFVTQSAKKTCNQGHESSWDGRLR
jgi:enoyl-CoA hydratase